MAYRIDRSLFPDSDGGKSATRGEAHKPFTLPHLIEWLASKPAHEEYCYTHTGRCLAAQYHKEHGKKYSMEWISELLDNEALFHRRPFKEQLEFIAIKYPRTFSGALNRARAYAASKPRAAVLTQPPESV